MKKILLIFTIAIFFVSFVSAFDWDNASINHYYSSENATMVDNVDFDFNGTNSGTTGIGGRVGQARYYDGSDLYNFTQYAFSSTGITYSFWLWTNNSGTSDCAGDGCLIYTKGFNASVIEWVSLAGDEIRFAFDGDATGQSSFATDSANIQNDTWYHIVITGSGNGADGNYHIFINTINQSLSVGSANDYPTIQPNNVFIGGDSVLLSKYTTGIIDEFLIMNSSVTAENITELYNGGLGLGFGLQPTGVTTTLNSPTNNTNQTDNVLFNATLNPRDFDLVNSTLYIWFPNGTTFSTTTNSMNTSTNESLFTSRIPGLLSGYLWNVLGVQGDGNGSNSSFAISNNSFDIQSYLEVSQTFTELELGGMDSPFSTVVNLSSNYSILIPYLVHNGTSYEGTFSSNGNNQFFINRTLSLPFVNSTQNVTFYWNISLNDSSFVQLANNSQNISNISMDDCSTFSNLVFNYTMRDEENEEVMVNTTIEYAFNIYDISQENLFFSYNKSSTDNPSPICLSTSLTGSSNYSLTGTVKYYGNDSYVTRYYNYLNYSLANDTLGNEIDLYSVNDSRSLPFLLTFRDVNSALAPGILVQVHKQFLATNDFKIVEIPLTDTNGQTILNLIRNEAVYNLIMIDRAGTVIATFPNLIAFCQDFTIESCSIDLTVPSTGEITYNYSTDIGISYAITFSNSSQTISLTFNTLDSTAKTIRMLVQTQNQFENSTICDTSLTTSSGVLNCDVSGSTSANQFFFVSTYSEGKLVSITSVNTNPSLPALGGSLGVNGFFFAILIVLFFILILAEDKQTLILGLGFGWVTIIALGLVKGTILGTETIGGTTVAGGGIWLIVTIIIFLWKLRRDEGG